MVGMAPVAVERFPRSQLPQALAAVLAEGVEQREAAFTAGVILRDAEEALPGEGVDQARDVSAVDGRHGRAMGPAWQAVSVGVSVGVSISIDSSVADVVPDLGVAGWRAHGPGGGEAERPVKHRQARQGNLFGRG